MKTTSRKNEDENSIFTLVCKASLAVIICCLHEFKLTIALELLNLIFLFFYFQDMTEATALSAIEQTTVGIYITRETPGNDFPDVGIIVEGVVVLQDLDNVALATAFLFGLFYSLNMRYPSQLRFTFEVIQTVIMELDATQLSRKAQNLKTKLLQ